MQILSIFVTLSAVVAHGDHSRAYRNTSSRLLDVTIEDVFAAPTRRTTSGETSDTELLRLLNRSNSKSRTTHSSHRSSSVRGSPSRSSSDGAIRVSKSDLYDVIKLILESRACTNSGTCDTYAQPAPQVENPYGYNVVPQATQYTYQSGIAQYSPYSACTQCRATGQGCTSCPYYSPATTPVTPSASVSRGTIVNNYYNRMSAPNMKSKSTQTSSQTDRVIIATPRDINAPQAQTPKPLCANGLCNVGN